MSICLNMIVKNESAIIRSTLENLTKYVKFAYWVICDTGSTDGTQSIIKEFFAGKKIPGELYEDKWENFGHNRTLALERAYKKSDYILIFDADDAFNGDLKLPKLESTKIRLPNSIDRIGCKFGYGTDFTWYRPVILNNNIKWKYFGVLHEFIECVEPDYTPNSLNLDGNYYIEARTIGGDRNKDDKKYYKDAILLEKALVDEQDPSLKARYTFYCAQSFRDFGDFVNAIRYYKLRITQGHFDEEIHVSYYNAGKLMIHIMNIRTQTNTVADRSGGPSGLPFYSEEEIVNTLFDGWTHMKDRSECLYELAKYYRLKGNYAKAYLHAKIGAKIPFPRHRVLFLHKDIYDWRLKDELAINSFYLEKYQESIKYNQKILRFNQDQRILENMLFSVNETLKIVLQSSNRNFTLSKNRLLGLTFVIRLKDNVELCKILMNSLLLHMNDMFKMERFILVYPDSKNKEAEEFKSFYPFFELISFKHPTHMLGNIKSKLNRHDRFIFYMQEGWISYVKKNYFHKSLSILNSDKKFGQFIFNRANSDNVDQYISNSVQGLSVPDPKDDNREKNKYYQVDKYKTPGTTPVIYRREYFDAMNSFEAPVDENFTTVFQNQIDFCTIRKQ